jgi:Primase C terminal 1 (PriCT-1)/Bifunctional DNA primase/polymerase, N-terminal
MSFPAIQAAYALHRVATYPLSADKTPAVRAYDRIGAPYSARLVLRFPDATAAGFCAGRRNGLTVIDIDSTDDRLVDEIQARFGASPLQVITPSGGRHLYYRHGGEARGIRPLPHVDILGAGNVVAAGSKTGQGCYQIERGSHDDLDRLPRLAAFPAPPQGPAAIPAGQRDDTLFRRLLREARHCDDFETLLDVARTLNMDCAPPLTDNHVAKIARSVWHYETTGNNWVGRKARASTDRDEILAFSHDPAAALLLNLLRVSHPGIGDRFAIDQVATANLLGWDRERLRAKIKVLIEAKRLRIVYRGRGKGDPHRYELVR